MARDKKARYQSESRKAYKKRQKKNNKEKARLGKLQIVRFEERVESVEVENEINTHEGLNSMTTVLVKEDGEVAQPIVLRQPQQNGIENEAFPLLLQQQPQQDIDVEEGAKPLQQQPPLLCTNNKKKTKKQPQQKKEHKDKVKSSRKKLPVPWSPEEVSMLKLLYYRFAVDGECHSWKKILHYGFGVFDHRRTNEHLKDKWKRMKANGEV